MLLELLLGMIMTALLVLAPLAVISRQLSGVTRAHRQFERLRSGIDWQPGERQESPCERLRIQGLTVTRCRKSEGGSAHIKIESAAPENGR